MDGAHRGGHIFRQWFEFCSTAGRNSSVPDSGSNYFSDRILFYRYYKLDAFLEVFWET